MQTATESKASLFLTKRDFWGAKQAGIAKKPLTLSARKAEFLTQNNLIEMKTPYA